MTAATPNPAAEATLQTLHTWADAGWLRPLDSQLAAFVLRHDAQATPQLLMATAMLAHLEGRGHTCLPLAVLHRAAQSVLAWPDTAHTAFSRWWAEHPASLAQWRQALQRSPVVRQVPAASAQAPVDLFAQADALVDDDSGQPLVLAGSADAPLLYLRRYWQHEQAVMHGVAQRAGTQHRVDPAQVRQWLDRLFAPADPSTPASAEPDWQRCACALALRAGLTVVTGGPGTGKTYTAARLLALLWATHPQPSHLKVALAAPTGKAAARLRQSIDQALAELGPRLAGHIDLPALAQTLGAASTVHALLGAQRHSRAFRHHAQALLDVDVLIVDETSMIHLELMAALLAALPPHARLVLLGDKDQLASVEAGSVLGDLCAHADTLRYNNATRHYLQASTGTALPESGVAGSAIDQQTVMLRQSRRFGTTIGAVALAVNAGRAHTDTGSGQPGAYELLRSGADSAVTLMDAPVAPDAVARLAAKGRAGAPVSYADYLQLVQARAPGAMDVEEHSAWAVAVLRAFVRFRILCEVHQGPWGDVAINTDVQRALTAAGLLKPAGEWFEGRPVMITRNDKALGVFNGDVGVALRHPAGDKLRVYFLDGDQLRSVPVSRLAHVDTAFAMTIHKSQGSEFAHTVVVLPDAGGDILTRELIYTGVTRARTHLTVVEPRAGLLGQATAQRVLRSSGWGA